MLRDLISKGRESMLGHVFVSNCDITKLACDSWLVPTNKDKVVLDHWINTPVKELGVGDGDFSKIAFPVNFGDECITAIPKDWPDSAEYPMPVFTITASDEYQEIDWYSNSVTQFVEEYLKTSKRYLSFRVRPLLAIPLVGTGSGGAVDRVASIIKAILICTQGLVIKYDVDIVITTLNSFHYGVCQMERKRLDKEFNYWPELTGDQRASGKKIAEYANEGKLVLFLGAGVSAGAGLPSWGQLLDHLSNQANMSDDQKKALSQFNFLDQAEILKKELKKLGIDMNREIAALLSSKDIYSLAHTLISDWPVNEAVTQNYDDMFERACRDSEKPLSVIPYTFENESPKWLLKMHGCVTAPEDIVLSRTDYLDYDYSKSALSGIVQALLVTKHMLFLGFSLTDDHFIQLIFGVHKALSGMLANQEGHKFGTVLSPVHSTFQEELWTHELNFVNSDIKENDLLGAIGWHDSFLDYVTSLVYTSHNYLFHEEYESLLSEDEILLRDTLGEAYNKVKSHGSSEMVKEFEEYLSSLGHQCGK
jgi:hypothetical protein